jgi:hypothetical protein
MKYRPSTVVRVVTAGLLLGICLTPLAAWAADGAEGDPWRE